MKTYSNFRKNQQTPTWYSSYEKNNYGELFYSLMRIYRPEKVVELGTLTGYSAYHMARGLFANGKGTLDCYDLWEKYDNNDTFYSFPQPTAEENLKEFKSIIRFHPRNVIGVDKEYKAVDILHVDVENDGGILEKIIPFWINKTRQIIIIEGSSAERDQEGWMILLNKLPIKKWNVVKLQLEYPADLLLVDNSPGLNYMEKVKGYCTKYGITNYQIEHVEIDQKLIPDMRIEVSQEMIRRYVVSHDYDAWFSWECDQLIPTNALSELTRIMKAGDFMMVNHNCWSRQLLTQFNTDMGCVLIKRECLEKNDFLPERNGYISFDVSDRYEDMMFKERFLREGGNYVEVYGVITPIYHLTD